jgi:hypothetical protein
VNEFEVFRLEACKHGAHLKDDPGQFWATLLKGLLLLVLTGKGIELCLPM